MPGCPIVSSFQSCSTAPYIGGRDPIQFSSMTDLKFSRFAESDDTWDVINNGITFSGICGTRTCREYKNNVCCKLSKGVYGKFDLAKDNCDCVCPCCEKPVKMLDTCCFYNCKWKYTGMVQESSTESEFELPNKYIKRNGSGLANARNGYFEYTGDLTNWRFLEFNVKKIPESELVDY